VGHHSLKVVRKVNELAREKDFPEKERTMLVYAALLHDVAKPDCRVTDGEGIDHFHAHPEKGAERAREILRRLKFDNETVAMVVKLILYHDRRYENCYIDGAYSTKGKRAMRRLVNQAGEAVMPLLFVLQRADLLAQSEYMREEKLTKLSAGEKCYQEIRQAGEAVKISDLAVTGRDLMGLGVPSGPELGEILRRLLDQVMDAPEKNTKEKLCSMAKEWLDRE
jgi:tRNA nucleotidyltransferase (CCA-adding enzyme)